jgi:hypothetical protein
MAIQREGKESWDAKRHNTAEKYSHAEGYLHKTLTLHMKEIRRNEGLSEKEHPTYKIIIINILFHRIII